MLFCRQMSSRKTLGDGARRDRGRARGGGAEGARGSVAPEITRGCDREADGIVEKIQGEGKDRGGSKSCSGSRTISHRSPVYAQGPPRGPCDNPDHSIQLKRSFALVCTDYDCLYLYPHPFDLHRNEIKSTTPAVAVLHSSWAARSLGYKWWTLTGLGLTWTLKCLLTTIMVSFLIVFEIGTRVLRCALWKCGKGTFR